MNKIGWTLMRGVGRLLGALLGGIRIEGKEHVPRTGPFLVIANHSSDCDPPFLWMALPRRAWFMAKSELFQIKLLGPFIRWIGAFPVHRGSADRNAIRFTEERLKEGEIVVIFPEGHLSETGQMEEFQPGAALIALRAEVPVLPAGLIGTLAILPYGRLFPKRSRRPVQVRFGPALDLQDLYDRPRQEAVEEATRRMEAAVAQLADQPIPHRRDAENAEKSAEEPQPLKRY